MKRGLWKEKRMGKKAQFYILAAVIIISIIVGIVVIRNYVIRGEPKTKVYDLGEEIGIESGNVIDHGIYQEDKTPQELMDRWTAEYYEYVDSQGVAGDWLLIYGNKKEIIALTFSSISAGWIGISFGERKSGSDADFIRLEGREKFSDPEDEISVKFKDYIYDFRLNEGENFFFIISEDGYVIQG